MNQQNQEMLQICLLMSWIKSKCICIIFLKKGMISLKITMENSDFFTTTKIKIPNILRSFKVLKKWL